MPHCGRSDCFYRGCVAPMNCIEDEEEIMNQNVSDDELRAILRKCRDEEPKAKEPSARKKRKVFWYTFLLALLLPWKVSAELWLALSAYRAANERDEE